MLVVRQRRAPVAAPPFHTVPGMGPAGQEDVEGDREGAGVEAPTHSLGQASVGRASYGDGSRVFAHDEKRMHGSGESPRRRGGGDDSEGAGLP